MIPYSPACSGNCLQCNLIWSRKPFLIGRYSLFSKAISPRINALSAHSYIWVDYLGCYYWISNQPVYKKTVQYQLYHSCPGPVLLLGQLNSHLWYRPQRITVLIFEKQNFCLNQPRQWGKITWHGHKQMPAMEYKNPSTDFLTFIYEVWSEMFWTETTMTKPAWVLWCNTR